MCIALNVSMGCVVRVCVCAHFKGMQFYEIHMYVVSTLY